MGVTIESKNKSIDLGYIGFNNLRCKVAELAGEDIFEHYKYLDNVPVSEEERRSFYIKYNKRIAELDLKYEGEKKEILDFLYTPDCDGTMDVKHCAAIYRDIKDYDDDIAYGYTGRPDCAKFKDFKDILKDCIDNKCEMTWF